MRTTKKRRPFVGTALFGLHKSLSTGGDYALDFRGGGLASRHISVRNV